ncbi:MAG: ribbon-helix-helix protein, CopG family [Chloroflexi bacterium]|nr:ribbon-helix-helix protein, CopG family [Chloroflexota bacterium]
MRALAKKPIQIYLEPTQDKALRVLAQRKGISLAELIRRTIDHYLAELPVEEDPALRVIGLGHSGREDMASKHDDYLAAFTREETL